MSIGGYWWVWEGIGVYKVGIGGYRWAIGGYRWVWVGICGYRLV